MSEFNFTTWNADPSNPELIEAGFRDLAETAKANIDRA